MLLPAAGLPLCQILLRWRCNKTLNIYVKWLPPSLHPLSVYNLFFAAIKIGEIHFFPCVTFWITIKNLTAHNIPCSLCLMLVCMSCMHANAKPNKNHRAHGKHYVSVLTSTSACLQWLLFLHILHSANIKCTFACDAYASTSSKLASS